MTGRVDSVLVDVPLCSPLHPKAAMPFLKGFLRQNGYSTRVIDANIRFFRWFLRDHAFDFSGWRLRDHPVDLLDLYNAVEEALAVEASRYRGLSLDLRTVAFGYDRRSFEEVLLAVDDRQANPMIEFFDLLIETEIQAMNPRIVGVSVTFQDSVIAAFTLAKRLRVLMPDVKIVLGGQMITRCHDTLRASGRLDPLWDYLVLWDGEWPLLDLHRRIVGRQDVRPHNVMCADRGEFEPCIGRDVSAFDLDLTEHPDFEDIDFDDYFFPEILVPLQTARGCYGSCRFCAIPYGSNAGFRERSVDKILGDIEAVQEQTLQSYGRKAVHFKFMDDTSSPRTLFGLASGIKGRGIEARWETYVRMEKAFEDPDRMRGLYEGGCRKLMWGLETNDPDVLKGMNKKVTSGSTEKVLDASAQAGILNFVFVLLGFPGETDAQRRALLEFICKKKSIHVLTLATFDVTKNSPIQASLTQANDLHLDCESPQGFEVRLPYTLKGANWKEFIVREAQRFMLEVTRERTDIALVSLFPDQVRACLTDRHGNTWGEQFLDAYGRDNLRRLLSQTEQYIGAFERAGEVELSMLPDPLKREHFRTREDIQAISRAVARRKKYEVRRCDSI